MLHLLPSKGGNNADWRAHVFLNAILTWWIIILSIVNLDKLLTNRNWKKRLEIIPSSVGLHSIRTWKGFFKFNPCSAIFNTLTSSPTKDIMEDCWDWNYKRSEMKRYQINTKNWCWLHRWCRCKLHNVKLNTTQRWWWWILQWHNS